MNPYYAEVALRAAHRCEYCRAPEAVFNFPFEVEHIIPTVAKGADALDNLALACRACNLRKADHMAARDPETAAEVRLFHPRLDRWEEHFAIQIESAIVYGLTPIGRATVADLGMNVASQLAARIQWVRLGLFP